MAHDLASQPHTGLMVQACGDAHLLNFGLFAVPERNLVFALNDFDETHAAPWEWDVKRPAAGHPRRQLGTADHRPSRLCIRGGLAPTARDASS